MDIEKHLVDFALRGQGSAPSRDMMRLSLLDWTACALAGRGEAVSCILRQMVEEEATAGPATMLGSDQSVAARGAALVNGATSHALDYDDTHFAHIGHPSVVVIPAVLAVAEQVNASGPAILDAALIGVETSIRVGVWLGRSHYQAGFHQTATAGIFSATLAVGRLLGLSSDQMHHGLGLASTRAAGLKSQFGTMGKPYHAGLAAAGGVEAALLAVQGFRSNPLGLSGPKGFGETHAGEANVDALDGLGEHWMFETISHKFHACCHGLHAMLEALAELNRGVAPADVASLTITTHPRWQVVCNQSNPSTGLGVKFSYRHTAAMSLAGVDTRVLDSFSDALAVDPDLIALRDRVVVVFDPGLAETASEVRLSLKDGTHRTAVHDLSCPMLMTKRRKKLLAKAEALLGLTKAKTIWQAINPVVDLPALQKALTQ